MHTTSWLVHTPRRRRWPGPLVLLIWLLITAVAATYMYAITPQIPVCMSAPAAAAHIIGGLFGLGCLLASYYQLTSQEPLTTADIPLQVLKEDMTMDWSWCLTCSRPKPPLAHHCSTCRKCVLRMDHHCWWAATCIGLSNYTPFLRFTVWLWLGSLYAAGSTWWLWTRPVSAAGYCRAGQPGLQVVPAPHMQQQRLQLLQHGSGSKSKLRWSGTGTGSGGGVQPGVQGLESSGPLRAPHLTGDAAQDGSGLHSSSSSSSSSSGGGGGGADGLESDPYTLDPTQQPTPAPDALLISAFTLSSATALGLLPLLAWQALVASSGYGTLELLARWAPRKAWWAPIGVLPRTKGSWFWSWHTATAAAAGGRGGVHQKSDQSSSRPEEEEDHHDKEHLRCRFWQYKYSQGVVPNLRRALGVTRWGPCTWWWVWVLPWASSPTVTPAGDACMQARSYYW